MKPFLTKGLLEQGRRKLDVGRELNRHIGAEFTSIDWAEADISEHAFAEVMTERLNIARRENPTHWIFMTPTIQIVSLTLSSGFVRACHAAEHRWIARVSRLLKPFLNSPRAWPVVDALRFRSRSKEKFYRFLCWTLNCRGNMFPPNKGLVPNQSWRKICGGSGKLESCEGRVPEPELRFLQNDVTDDVPVNEAD